MTPDYALLGVSLFLILSAWWLSEKLQQIRDEYLAQQAQRKLERKLYELQRSSRGWE